VRRVALILATTLLALAAATAPATAATPKTSLNAVESEVMCVSCGVPLAIAESPQADAERKEIARLIAQGKTKDQIKDALVAQYGDRVLATPKDEGFGLAAYLVPIALVLLALAAGLYFVPKWRAKRTPGDPAAAGASAGPRISDADARRLEEDLARYEV
jgi:cytochrome c-type biogenesis protein CcmH/NrfF